MSTLYIYTDGASRGNPGMAGAGIFAQLDDKTILLEQSIFLGNKTNNEAEYMAFLASVWWLVKFKPDQKFDKIIWHLDSKLVVEQVNKNWKIKKPQLIKLVQQCWQALENLDYQIIIKHIPREQNTKADALANVAMDLAQAINLRL